MTANELAYQSFGNERKYSHRILARRRYAGWVLYFCKNPDDKYIIELARENDKAQLQRAHDHAQEIRNGADSINYLSPHISEIRQYIGINHSLFTGETQ
jgi:hypothetical protein